MTKEEIIAGLKGFTEKPVVVCGFNIVCVMSKTFPYMVIEDCETIEEAKMDNFIPIDQFRTLENLVEELYKISNKYK